MLTIHKVCDLVKRRHVQVRDKIDAFLSDLEATDSDVHSDVFSLLYSIYWGNRYYESKMRHAPALYEVLWYILRTPEIVSLFMRDDWFKLHYLTLLNKTSCMQESLTDPLLIASRLRSEGL